MIDKLLNEIKVYWQAAKYFVEDWGLDPGSCYWNYRIVRVIYPGALDEIQYELHEVYYKRNKPWLRTQDAIVSGESVEEVIDSVDKMVYDIMRHPVLEDSVFPKEKL
jgi:hypothetical protein